MLNIEVGAECQEPQASRVAQWWRSSCQCRRLRRYRFDLGSGSSPWRRKWQPTPVFLPGKSHGQTSLGWGGYSPWDCRVGHDWMTEHRCTHARNHSIWAPHTDSDEGKLVNTKLELELSLHPKSKPSTSFFWAFFHFLIQYYLNIHIKMPYL